MNKIGIVYKPLSEITPYKNNPRNNRNAIEPVKESIKKYGFKVPIILDAHNVIVTGHTRYEAAKQLGMSEVPVIYATDLTEQQVREFRLVDNKVSEFATWDFSKLEKELNGLDFGGFDFDFEMPQWETAPAEQKPQPTFTPEGVTQGGAMKTILSCLSSTMTMTYRNIQPIKKAT